jgi:hypothetical protein
MTDLFVRWGLRRGSGPPSTTSGHAAANDAPIFPTKALAKFLGMVAVRDAPTLLDLGQVVGSNVSFFGERLGCKILVEDLFGDLDRHTRGDRLDQLAAFFESRFPYDDASVDGVLCWDLVDHLERPAAAALAGQLTRLLRPGGCLLGFFGTADARSDHFTKFVVVDDARLQYRSYPAAEGRRRAWPNRDIIKLFEGLLVSESFLLKSNTREILFRKPAYLGAGRTPS